MKFEVGKFYKTRDGRKAKVVYTDAGIVYPVVAIIDDKPYSFRADGCFELRGEHSIDLIAEWGEPEPKKERLLAWMDTVGAVRLVPASGEVDGHWTRIPHLDQPEPRTSDPKPKRRRREWWILKCALDLHGRFTTPENREGWIHVREVRE